MRRNPRRTFVCLMAACGLALSPHAPEDGMLEGARALRPHDLPPPEPPFAPVLTRPRLGAGLNVVEIRVNDRGGDVAGAVQAEISLAVSGDTLVCAWNDQPSEFPACQCRTGYGFSTDRGESWADAGSVPGGPGVLSWGDPSLAALPGGEWVLTSLDLDGTRGMAVSRGRFTAGALDFDPALEYLDGNFLDKEYIDHDPATGALYAAYSNENFEIRFTRSVDGGATWGPRSTLSDPSFQSVGALPAHAPDGGVFVAWYAADAASGHPVRARHSPDGGMTWPGAIATVATRAQDANEAPTCFNRTFDPLLPAIAVDNSHGPYRGRVYVAWNDGPEGDKDCFASTSDDQGATWSPPVRLNDTIEREQFWPTLHVGPAGRATAGWFDRRNGTEFNALCDVYVAQSVDGGASWGMNRRASSTSVSWCGVPANASPNFGDYIDIVSDAASVWVGWADAREGDPDVYVARLDDVAPLAGTLPGTARGAFDGTFWRIPNAAELEVPPSIAGRPAVLHVVSLALSMLATADDVPGIFEASGGRLSGTLTLHSTGGSVDGSFSVDASAPGPTDVAVELTADSSLDGFDFDGEWTSTTTLRSLAQGTVSVAGTATLPHAAGTLEMTVTGRVTLDGFPAGLITTQTLDAHSSTPSGALRTQASVSTGSVVATPQPELPPHAHPTARLGAAPNPFRDRVTIVADLSQAGRAELDVFTVSGRLVRSLFAGRFRSGRTELVFDGRDAQGRPLAPGLYVARLSTPHLRVVQKLVLMP